MTMMLIPGPAAKSPLTVDAEGHRSYKIKFKCIGDTTDGPANAYQTPGLPLPGSMWQFDSDLDVWAWCREECTVSETVTDEPNRVFIVEKFFSTKPPGRNQSRCNDSRIEDPLLEPHRISGDFNRFTEEATHDRFGKPIVNSAWEQFRGALVEFDASRFSITIEQNVPNLQIGLLNALKDCVNDAPLWGLPARCIKFTAGPWERKFYGQCYVYFTRKLILEANAKQSVDASGNLLFDAGGNPIIESGWDRVLLDEGDKAIHGHWGILSKGEVEGRWIVDNIDGVAPDRQNPAHFDRVMDRQGNPMHVILDGLGAPVSLADINFHVSPVAQAGGGTVEIANAGVNYAVKDTITLAGGTFTTAAVLKVERVLPNGEILAVSIANPGAYTVKPANPVSQGTTSGSGTGAQFNLVWTVPSKGTDPGRIPVQKYRSANLLLLGIPLIIG